MATFRRQYPVPMGMLRATDDLRYWSNELLTKGFRQSNGLSEPRPLLPSQKRDLEIALRAIERFYAADEKR